MGIKSGAYSTVENPSVFITTKHHKLELKLLLESVDPIQGGASDIMKQTTRKGCKNMGTRNP